ncbi:hypothetical protein ICW40_10805, partial [Actinotalea ferrariae]|nr:hypothetical protein [Actinotalea ferrariae]
MLERVRGLPRRTLVAACAALACALALVVTLVVVQVRAADAAERREA